MNFLSPTSGVVNAILKACGHDPVYFLATPAYFVPIYTLMNIWKSTGYGSIVYIAALTSISEDLYEAAQVDGAGRWKQFLHVTLPGLMPTIVIMLLIQLGGILNVGYEYCGGPLRLRHGGGPVQLGGGLDSCAGRQQTIQQTDGYRLVVRGGGV